MVIQVREVAAREALAQRVRRGIVWAIECVEDGVQVGAPLAHVVEQRGQGREARRPRLGHQLARRVQNVQNERQTQENSAAAQLERREMHIVVNVSPRIEGQLMKTVDDD